MAEVTWGNYAGELAGGHPCIGERSLLSFSAWAAEVLMNFLPSTDTERDTERDTRKRLFLDVAAGSGFATTELWNALHRRGALRTGEDEFLVTDISAAMVEAAEGRLDEFARRHFPHMPAAFFECHLMDAEAPDVPEGSVDALLCLFGLMFFPHRHAALQSLLRALKPGAVALVSTWSEMDLAEISEDFSVFCGTPEGISNPYMRSVLSVGHSPADLRQELTQAGFVNVQIFEREEVFEIEDTDKEFLLSSMANPVLSRSFTHLQMPPAQLKEQWHLFLESPMGKRWSKNNGHTMTVKMKANLAVAFRPLS